ncbi:MAG TPA: methyltransferase domain-containing protein [Actinomycetota bacterium]|nr:methyltransferase domain-containing protein [Actinomycetota bacterium]
MRTQSLSWLACPAAGCEGALSPGDSPQARWGDTGGAELLEGVLECRGCGARYPVILGVALLSMDLQSYLWTFWTEIESCAALTPQGVSREMVQYLGIPSAFTGQAGPPAEADHDLEWSTSPYLQTHFDSRSLTDELDEGWWRDAVQSHLVDSSNPYRHLMEAVRDASGHRSDGLAVEVGTSVGRGSAELAGCFEYSLGVDQSFRAILAARSLLLGEPARMTSYRVQTEKGRWEAKNLTVPTDIANLDFVVASGNALPVRSSGASCVAAVNVLCAVSEPLAMLDELARILARRGTVLISSPFWSDSDPDGESPLALGGPEFLRENLRRDFEVVSEKDMVPWLLRLAKRRWNVYLCHCVVATRR